MGLDMYLYRATRIPEKELTPIMGKKLNEIRQLPRLCVLTRSEINSHNRELSPLLPYTKEIEIEITYIDFDKIKSAHNIDTNAEIYTRRFNSESVTYECRSTQNGDTELSLKWKEIEENYSYTQTETAYVVYLDRIAYWRKEYDLQTKIYEYLGNVENCAYNKVTKELFNDVIVKNSSLQYSDFVDNDDNAIFYHEWY